MNSAQRELWTRIQSHRFDPANAENAFAQRLAKEQNWTLDFARRAIEEYRRFLFLCTEAGHPCTPSQAVDEVWHTHLVFTRNYWHDLCRDTLGRELHHDPGSGKTEEGRGFRDQYSQTLASYETFFGPAPTDLWPQPVKASPKQNPTWLAVLPIGLLAGCAINSGASGGIILFPILFGGFVLILIAALRNAAKSDKKRRNGQCTTGGGADFGGSGCGSTHHHSSGHDGGHHSHCGTGSHCSGGSHCGSSGDSGGSSCGSNGCGSSCGGGGGD